MMNFVAKSLVLVHAVLSVGGMTWAIMVCLQARDFGWKEPYKEVLEWTADGNVKSALLHASEYDKSQATVVEAARTRDRIYARVKPAIESIRATEPYLASNHLFFMSELRHLSDAPDPIEVRRLKQAGLPLDTPGSDLGKPVPEDKALDGITKSYKIYKADLKKLGADIATIEMEKRKIIDTTKKIAAELTGTDEENKYVQPGLYQLTDLEFKNQQQIKVEIDAIKPNWSKAVEHSRLYQYRRADLQSTLDKLKAAPMRRKIEKKT